MATSKGPSFKRQHKWAQENLSAFIDGQLSAEERARFKQHMADCLVCQADVSTLRATKKLLADLERVPVPHSFTLSASAVSEQKHYRRTMRMFAVMRTATVTTAALFLITFAGSAYLSGTYSLSTASIRGENTLPFVANTSDDDDFPDAIAPMANESALAFEETPLATSTSITIVNAPGVRVLDTNPVNDSLAEVAGPQEATPVSVAEAATPTIDGIATAHGGGGITTSSVTEGDAGVDVDSVTLDAPIVMLPEEALFGSSAESNSETGGTFAANPAPDSGTDLAPTTKEAEPTQVAEVVSPVTEPAPAEISTTEDTVEQDESSARTIVIMRIITCVFGGVLLIALAGLVWFGSVRRTL